MAAFITPPRRLPFYLRPGIWLAEKVTGRELLAARLLAWFPRAAIGSGLLEALAAHGRNLAEKRLLRLARLQAAFAAACPFCVDMNAFELAEHGVSAEEFAALQTNFRNGYPPTISTREKLALEYARLISATPLAFPADFIAALKHEFSEREIVVLATAVAQVNYWARLIQALGVPPAGFSAFCLQPENITNHG